jgi:hypothetical protein
LVKKIIIILISLICFVGFILLYIHLNSFIKYDGYNDMIKKPVSHVFLFDNKLVIHTSYPQKFKEMNYSSHLYLFTEHYDKIYIKSVKLKYINSISKKEVIPKSIRLDLGDIIEFENIDKLNEYLILNNASIGKKEENLMYDMYFFYDVSIAENKDITCYLDVELEIEGKIETIKKEIKLHKADYYYHDPAE